MDGQRKALLLIDIQNDYFPGGKMELEGSLAAAGEAAKALAAFRSAGLPVIHVRHLSTRPGASFFVPGTPGSEIHSSVAPREGESVVLKNFPNSFRGTELESLLKGLGVGELVVCGMMTHMCVDTTARAAFDLGFKVKLVRGATATRQLLLDGAPVPAAQVQASFLAALSPLFCELVPVSAILES